MSRCRSRTKIMCIFSVALAIFLASRSDARANFSSARLMTFFEVPMLMTLLALAMADSQKRHGPGQLAG